MENNGQKKTHFTDRTILFTRELLQIHAAKPNEQSVLLKRLFVLQNNTLLFILSARVSVCVYVVNARARVNVCQRIRLLL